MPEPDVEVEKAKRKLERHKRGTFKNAKRTLEWIEQNYVPIKEDISLDWQAGAVLIAACLGSVFFFQGGT